MAGESSTLFDQRNPNILLMNQHFNDRSKPNSFNDWRKSNTSMTGQKLMLNALSRIKDTNGHPPLNGYLMLKWSAKTSCKSKLHAVGILFGSSDERQAPDVIDNQ